MIEIHELTKYYGARRAVGPLSFSIQQGEVVGLLGLNGAGKTTTLRMLSSDLLPTSGRLIVDGVDLVDTPEKVRARIGYLPDRPPLYDDMSVREYLHFAAKLRNMRGSGVAKRVDEVIEQTAVGDYADDPISTLSHGYRQRVGIAQAIIHKPALLLLDEPISGLDPVQIVEMRALIRSFRGEHTTVLSSHILSEISETCDRLLVILEGEIVASGSEAELSQQMTSHNYAVTVVVTDGQPAAAVAVAEGIGGVDHCSVGVSAEALPDAVVLEVAAQRDVRIELCRALVTEGIGIVELGRSAKELESVFLQLTGAQRGGLQ